MNKAAHSERAITEIMGPLILVAIFATALGIIGITYLSQPAPLKIPVADVAIFNESKMIRVYHAGGDPIPLSEFSLRVDDQNITFAGAGSDNIWSIGETLVAVAPLMPHKVDVVLNSPFNQLLTQRTLNQTSSVFPPLQTFTITASSDGGWLISPFGSVTVASGSDQEFTISPGFGFAIADVLVDGVSAGPVISYTFNSVTANHVIRAIFTSSSHTIQLNAAKDGELVSGGSVEFRVTGQYSGIT